MSKLLKLLCLAFTVFFISACGGGDTKDVEKAAKQITEAIYKGEGDKLVSYIYFPEEALEQPGMKEMFEGKFKGAAAEAKQLADRLGGFKSVDIIDLELDEKAGTARVLAEVNFKNSDADSKHERLSLIKHKGKWLLNID